MKSIFVSVLILGLTLSTRGWAWGKRGHAAVGITAARVLGHQENLDLPKKHAFDLSYMNNVPDVIWKSDDATYKIESPQHWIDFEPYFEKVGKDRDWSADRKTFFTQHQGLKIDYGRVPWRIQEMQKRLEGISEKLKSRPSPVSPEDIKTYHQLQEEWIVTAGTMGHYVADLGQPLHVTLDYDGEKCSKKGLHSFFEETVVDELSPQLEGKAYDLAKASWSEFKKKNQDKSAFELSLDLGKESFGLIGDLCKWDKARGRELTKVAPLYQDFIAKRLARAAQTLALIWKKTLVFTYHGEKFWNFSGTPGYIMPEKEPQ